MKGLALAGIHILLTMLQRRCCYRHILVSQTGWQQGLQNFLQSWYLVEIQLQDDTAWIRSLTGDTDS
jgi:hypothetical protein